MTGTAPRQADIQVVDDRQARPDAAAPSTAKPEPPVANPASSAIRLHACQLAAQLCQGDAPSAPVLLAYVTLFESYLTDGGVVAAERLKTGFTLEEYLR